jgi:hydroxypyruvate reductase
MELEGWPNGVVASLATDGEDGPTGAAGAMVTGETAAEARRRGLPAADYLAGHDSYHFFRQVGGLIETGPTGTNVNDIVMMLKYG